MLTPEPFVPTMIPVLETAAGWIISRLCDCGPVNLQSMMRTPQNLTIVNWALLPGPLTSLKIGMILQTFQVETDQILPDIDHIICA